MVAGLGYFGGERVYGGRGAAAGPAGGTLPTDGASQAAGADRGGQTDNTGQVACRMTRSVVEPSSSDSIRPRPRTPITIKFIFWR